jgi:hypothetical protein
VFEAIKGGLQSQTWHHDIISTRESPRIANTIWPSFSSVTVQGCTYMPTYLSEMCWNTLYIWSPYREWELSRNIFKNHVKTSVCVLSPTNYPGVCSLFLWLCSDIQSHVIYCWKFEYYAYPILFPMVIVIPIKVSARGFLWERKVWIMFSPTDVNSRRLPQSSERRKTCL